MTRFAQRLEILMTERDLNRSQVAKKVGVSASTVHRWFTRGSVPSLNIIEKLADYFGVDERWLRGLTEERKPEKEVVKQDESVLDDELVRTISSLTPAQLQRVRDFLAGLKG